MKVICGQCGLRYETTEQSHKCPHEYFPKDDGYRKPALPPERIADQLGWEK